MELTYAQLSQARPETPPAESVSTPGAMLASDASPNGLPAWAQRLLNGTEGDPFGSRGGASFRYNAAEAAGQNNGNGGKQITWTAPYARPAAAPGTPPAAGPTQMVFRQRGEDEAAEPWPQRQEFGEREARKMADKVYKIIEERLRKELRRGGK